MNLEQYEISFIIKIFSMIKNNIHREGTFNDVMTENMTPEDFEVMMILLDSYKDLLIS